MGSDYCMARVPTGVIYSARELNLEIKIMVHKSNIIKLG